MAAHIRWRIRSFGRLPIEAGQTISLLAQRARRRDVEFAVQLLGLINLPTGGFTVPMDDDIVAACLMTQGGEVKRK